MHNIHPLLGQQALSLPLIRNSLSLQQTSCETPETPLLEQGVSEEKSLKATVHKGFITSETPETPETPKKNHL